MSLQWKAGTDRVIVQCEAKQTHTPSGLALPDKADLEGGKKRGIVLASGPQATNILPGDVALFDVKYARNIGNDVFSVRAEDVLAQQREEQ